MAKSGSITGGIIGKVNKASFGKNKVTSVTGTGTHSMDSGTRLVNTVVVAGGASGGGPSGGGGGAGGLRNLSSVPVCGPVAITIGGGGATASCCTGTTGCNSIFIQLVLKVIVNLQPQVAVEVVEHVNHLKLDFQVARVVAEEELLQLEEQEMLDVTLHLKEMLEEFLHQLMKVVEVVVILQ